MGHGSYGSWVMGQVFSGSHGSWVTRSDPSPTLVSIKTNAFSAPSEIVQETGRTGEAEAVPQTWSGNCKHTVAVETLDYARDSI